MFVCTEVHNEWIVWGCDRHNVMTGVQSVEGEGDGGEAKQSAPSEFRARISVPTKAMVWKREHVLDIVCCEVCTIVIYDRSVDTC